MALILRCTPQYIGNNIYIWGKSYKIGHSMIYNPKCLIAWNTVNTCTVHCTWRDQPDIGSDVHLSTLQCCVHSQVDGVGCFAAVVLVNEHWVFCDVEASGIPGTNNAEPRQDRQWSPTKSHSETSHSKDLTYHPMMTSEGETLLWSSYMFFANSMSTATCHWRKQDQSTLNYNSNRFSQN